MGLPRRTYDRQRPDWAGNRDCWTAGAALATDHRRHTSGPPGANRIRDSGWRVVFLGAGINFLSSLQLDCRCIRVRRLADDTGWRRERHYRAGNRAVPEDALDHSGAGQHWLPCGFRVVDWLLSLYLFAGACAHAQGGNVCIRESYCRDFSGLDHFARTGRCVHAIRDGDYYCVRCAGEYLKVEACASRYTCERRDLPEDCECGGRLKDLVIG